jgi:hypothetical protein
MVRANPDFASLHPGHGLLDVMSSLADRPRLTQDGLPFLLDRRNCFQYKQLPDGDAINEIT